MKKELFLVRINLHSNQTAVVHGQNSVSLGSFSLFNLGRRPKEWFSLGTLNVGFILRAIGLQVPINFHFVSVGPHYPFKRHRVPRFLLNLTHFSQFSPIFTHIFPVFVLCTPILAVFMLGASLWTPNFCSFYHSGCL